MPIFDFVCKDCGKQFDVKISNAEKGKVKCPECNSSNINQIFSSFGSNCTRSTAYGQICEASKGWLKT